MLPGVSTLRPEYDPALATMRPRNSPATDPLRSQQELTDLIRMQTEAIKALSGKVDLLDDRLRRMENKLR
jgi:hypothetical protein